MNPSKAGVLTKVLIPVREGPESNNITWKTEFEADRLETALLEHCHSQYRRASETQFGHGPMQDLLGFHGLTQAADQILRGTLFENYDTDCFPGVKEFVSAMIIPKEMTNLTKITADEEAGMAGPEDLRLGTYQPSLKFK